MTDQQPCAKRLPVIAEMERGDERDEAAGRWVFDACRMFGASVATSHKVAGLFVAGIQP